MLPIPAIYDRTISDVTYANENRSAVEQLKGAQGSVAWNRLTGNMYYLAGLLTKYGYSVTMHSKYNWYGERWENDVLVGGADIPTVAEVQQIKDDLGLLQNSVLGVVGYTWSEWGSLGRSWQEIDERNRTAQRYFEKFNYFANYPLPMLPWTHFEKINDVEEITFVLDTVIDSIKRLFRFSGTFGAGQLSYLPHFVEVVTDAMSWIEFDQLQRTWEQMDAEQRTAANFFRRL